MISGERLFDESEIYDYIHTYAYEKQMKQTLCVLPYAEKLHQGQYRSGKKRVPYIYHPLMVAYHALTLGFDEDNMISAALLHDICEDCNIHPEALPVNDETREIVELLTHHDDYYRSNDAKKQYFDRIAKNKRALIIKLLDRCNNISSVAAGFEKARMDNYIKNTEEWFYPLFEKAKIDFPECMHQIFIIEYRLRSIIESIKNLK